MAHNQSTKPITKGLFTLSSFFLLSTIGVADPHKTLSDDSAVWEIPSIGKLVRPRPDARIEFRPIWTSRKRKAVAMVAETTDEEGNPGLFIQEASVDGLLGASRENSSEVPGEGGIFLPGQYSGLGGSYLSGPGRFEEAGIAVIGVGNGLKEFDNAARVNRIVVRGPGGRIRSLPVATPRILVHPNSHGVFVLQDESGKLIVGVLGFLEGGSTQSRMELGLHINFAGTWRFLPIGDSGDVSDSKIFALGEFRGDMTIGVTQAGAPVVLGLTQKDEKVHLFRLGLDTIDDKPILVHSLGDARGACGSIVGLADNIQRVSGSDEFFIKWKWPRVFDRLVNEGEWQVFSISNGGLHRAKKSLVAQFREKGNAPNLGRVGGGGFARPDSGELVYVITAAEWPWSKLQTAACFVGSGDWMTGANRLSVPLGSGEFSLSRSLLVPASQGEYLLMSAVPQWRPTAAVPVPESGSVSILHLAPGIVEPPAFVQTATPLAAKRFGTISSDRIFHSTVFEVDW